jgi:hypothetical protein
MELAFTYNGVPFIWPEIQIGGRVPWLAISPQATQQISNLLP